MKRLISVLTLAAVLLAAGNASAGGSVCSIPSCRPRSAAPQSTGGSIVALTLQLLWVSLLSR